jgi:hypothetical protein
VITESDLREILGELAGAAPSTCSFASSPRTRVSMRHSLRRGSRRVRAEFRRRPARASIVAVVTAGLLGTGAVAAYSAIYQRPVTDTTAVRCFASIDIHGDYVSYSSVDNPGDTPDMTDPIGSCAHLWRIGMLPFSGSHPSVTRHNADDPVPPLTECVIDTGVAGVFPNLASCSAIDLPSPH